MKNLANLLTLIIFLFYQTLAGQVGAAFDPGCDLPFADIAVRRDIDVDCGIEGQGTSRNTLANQIQNAAKNNFCATGTPQNVSITYLVNLHKKVRRDSITYGNYLSVPEDRSGLVDLGEGTKVRFTGYINHVKYANLSSGEGVNCKELRAENNDIHMELTRLRNESNTCKRISAEISPHFRPDDWSVERLREIEESEIKIRITGQLFFDASHTSCVDDISGGYRASSWEIHPVYQIEIYVNNQWINLHEFIYPHEDEEE